MNASGIETLKPGRPLDPAIRDFYVSKAEVEIERHKQNSVFEFQVGGAMLAVAVGSGVVISTMTLAPALAISLSTACIVAIILCVNAIVQAFVELFKVGRLEQNVRVAEAGAV